MRHVIHLPVAVADLTEALGLAYTVTRSLGSVPGVDAAGATVSAEDDQSVQHRV
ncbi:hypothetical protein ACN28G_05620 [Micromonospora sp. WMMA1923]|uniref:hypothetical protein n=1 Tax=Micromonospora sp. WMMA1923 TaxID=3404125 RepID=UPI003B966017